MLNYELSISLKMTLYYFLISMIMTKDYSYHYSNIIINLYPI